jgi:DASS family divalent anion:Na+ symporter
LCTHLLRPAAMAANPLAVNLAQSAGVTITWGGWALAALVPGLICLISVPLILYTLYPPEVRAWDQEGKRVQRPA